MTDRFAFWKGVSAGILGGIAIGVFTRLSAAEAARVRDSSATTGRLSTAPASADFGYPARKLSLRRDGAESAGDPRITGPVPTLAAVNGRAFERPPGAPGGRTPAEVLEVPGRPGKLMDHATHQHESVDAVGTEDAVPIR